MGDKETCIHHEPNMTRIARVEALSDVLDERTKNMKEDITELFTQSKKNYDKLSVIETCIARMESNLAAGFREQKDDVRVLRMMVTEDIGTIKESFESHVQYGEDMIAHYTGVVDEFKKKFTELEDFKWFRDMINKIRTNLFKYIFIIILSFLGIFLLLHWVSVGDILTRIIFKQ